MKSALLATLFLAAFSVQAQDPEVFPGLLDVLTPEDEAGSFIAGVCDNGTCRSARIEDTFPPEGHGPYPVVPADPLDLCSPLANAAELKGSFGLVDARTSGCADYYQGALIDVLSAGGHGVIFYNGDAPPGDDKALFNIIWDETRLILFPAVVITRYRGERLLAAIEAGEEVTATMRINPAVVSGEPGAEQEAGLGLSVYPNPGASPGLALELERPEAVRLAVYDVLGREVARLHDGMLGAGPHRFAVAGLPAGLYVVRAESAGVQVTRRLSVLH